MCHVRQFDPNATAAATGPPMDTPSTPVTDVTGQLPGPAAPKYKDTKFGKLLKVTLPLLQGGGIGGFGGNWRVPGSGSAAAGDYFAQRAQLALQQRAAAERIAALQSQERLRQSQEERNKFYDRYLQARAERDEAYQAKPEAEHMDVSSYPGMGVYTSGPHVGQARTLTGPEPAMGPSGYPDYSHVTATGPKPIGKSMQQTREERTAETQKQAELDRQTTHSDLQADRLQRHQEEQRREAMHAEEHKDTQADRAERAKDREARQGPPKGDVEDYAQEALRAAKKDPDKALEIINGLKSMPSDQKAAVRQRIREIAKPGKPATRQRISPDVLKSLSQGVPPGM